MKYYCNVLSRLLVFTFLSLHVLTLSMADNFFDFPSTIMLRTTHMKKKQQHSWWLLFSEHGFLLHSPGSDKHCLLRRNKSLLVRYCDGQLFINGTPIRDTDVYVYPVSGTIASDGQQLHAMRIHQRPNAGIAIVHYGLERNEQVAFLPAQTLNLTLPDIPYADIQAEDPLTLKVRVLLDEKKLNSDTSWVFATPHPTIKFKITSNDGSRKKILSKVPSLTITDKNGHFYINGKRIQGTHLFLESENDHITFAGNTYKGLFWLVRDDAQIMVINCLEIEDYVCSVLRTESWPGWPLETNKVLAIASRTYVVSMVLNAKKSKRLYHVKNTNEHQTYSGVHSNAVIKCAVDETRGVFLSHENKPIVAMFDSCCGGVVPAHIDGVNFEDAPYLAREYACTHCKRCKIYSWQAIYSLAELELMIQKHIPTFKKLHAVNIVKNDKAGLVQEAVLHGMHKSIVTGKKLYSLLPGVKSFCFSVKKNQEHMIFQGRGYGHHLGLCQWGAREMVRDGWDYKRILQFYYPNTEFMRLM